MEIKIKITDDIELEELNRMVEGINYRYSEYIEKIDLPLTAKEMNKTTEKEEKIKKEPNELDKLFGPEKKNKKDPFENLLDSNKDKDKKDSVRFF